MKKTKTKTHIVTKAEAHYAWDNWPLDGPLPPIEGERISTTGLLNKILHDCVRGAKGLKS